MNTHINLSGRLGWLLHSLRFFWHHVAVILGLGLIAAVCRVTQLGGFGQVSATYNIVLEVVIEFARILLFLYVLGFANVHKGWHRITQAVRSKPRLKENWQIAIWNVKKFWPDIVLSGIGFLLIAVALNYLIDLLVYQTCLYLDLMNNGILAPGSSEWTVLLFFKNLSVIPLTLVFDALFLLWITGKLQKATG